MVSGKIMLTTTPTVPGHEIVEYKGMVWGITVRCKNFVVDYLASWRQLFGGKMKGYSEMLEEARQQAVDRMIASARKKGANAVVEVYFDTEVKTKQPGNDQGASTSVTAYGTAVFVKPL